MVKIAVNLPPSDWYSHVVETMWATPIGSGRYRVENVPFYAYGISFADVVQANSIGDQLIIQDVAVRGGHSTYRAFLNAGVTIEHADFTNVWSRLQAIGASFEQASDRLLAVDIPPDTNIYDAYALLERGESAGVWDFEEAHCGHQLSE